LTSHEKWGRVSKERKGLGGARRNKASNSEKASEGECGLRKWIG